MSILKNDGQKAQESCASISGYYLHNRESLENVPAWVDRPESGTITIVLTEDTAGLGAFLHCPTLRLRPG